MTAQTPTFESTVGELASGDAKTRLRAVQILKAAAYPEGAVPLTRMVTDADDEVQLEAIAAELNIFLAEKVTPKRRVGLVIEIRGQIAAEPLFTAGPSVLGALRVPLDVLIALATASVDRSPRVAVEALYALGTLSGEVEGADRPVLLARTASLLAGIIGAPDPVQRVAAVRVVGRLFAQRPGDSALNESVGDAVISALNDREDAVRQTAMWALGSLRYERAVQALSQLFQYYRKGPLAEGALDALSHIGHEASLPLHVEHLYGKNAAFKLIAIEGIGRAGDRSRAEMILTMLKTEREEALLLAGHFAGVMLSDGSIAPLISSLGRPRLRDAAFQYVSEIAPGRTALFVKYTQNPDQKIRRDVADALGLSGDPAAIAVVERLTADKDPGVALAARRAIARLRSVAPPAS